MTTTPANVMEYSIRAPKNSKKRYHLMRFNGNLRVDIGKWTQAKMERENNMREYKINDEQPKFGAGSEFGREAKEEARRKKLGIIAKKYKADDQPWILECCDSTVKKFKGIREGGVSENAAYYVFAHTEDGTIEAFPLQEWYKFQPIQRYKCLSAEEAEQEFSKRNKFLNLNSLMLKKRLKGEDDTELNEEEKGKKTSHESKELKISEMDEWINSSDEDSSDEETKKEEEEEEIQDRKKSNKYVPKKKKRDTDVEAFEDSDDGDGEGRELDYISDSSDSEPENTNLESVAEEKALRKLLNSDDEQENSEESDKEMSNEDKEKEGKNAPDEKAEDKKTEPKKKAKKGSKIKGKKEKEERSSDFSLDSSTDDESMKKPKKQEKEISSENSSRCVIPTDSKRKIVNDALVGPTVKKIKLDLNPIPGLTQSGITEDAVRKYLTRKPMTTTALVQKFKSKQTGLSNEQLVNLITPLLKKINPVQQILNGKMYLSIIS